MKNKLITIIVPILLYPFSDLLGQLILHNVNYIRLFTLLCAAALFYQWEIPMFFKFIENLKFSQNYVKLLSPFLNQDFSLNALGKTTAATLYFNPIWIARHMIFLEIGLVSLSLSNLIHLTKISLYQGTMSFISTLPVVLAGNYIVQNKVPLNKRFLANSILSGILVIAYALGHKFF